MSVEQAEAIREGNVRQLLDQAQGANPGRMTGRNYSRGWQTVRALVDALILDLLEWIGPGPRPYAEVIDAWRTSCPRLPIWEEANERGFVERRHEMDRGAFVCVSPVGREFLGKHRRKAHARGHGPERLAEEVHDEQH